MQSADPAWVPPLLFDQKSRFKPSHPFFEHGAMQPFLAWSPSGEALGRICAIINQAHNDFHRDTVGFFGFFDCINNETVAAALFRAAGEYLKQHGRTVMRGPMNASVNEEIGMLIRGFDTPPAIMMTHNPPYYNDLVQACGFTKAKDILAYQLSAGEISERVVRLCEKIENRLALRIRPFNPRRFWDEVNRVREVYNSAWEANWGFVPMTDRELRLMAESLRVIYDPRLIFFAETDDGKPVGFSLALPDVHVLLKKMNGRLFPFGVFILLFGRRRIDRLRVLLMGVHRDYRGRGIDTVFYVRTYKAGIEAGYRWGEFSWVLEDNKAMNDAALAIGAVPYKVWRIWDKTLQ